MWLHPRGARDVAAALGVAMLVAGCSGSDPDDVEAAQATPEPTIEAPPDTETSPEPTDEPPASEEPEPETTIGENEPLYAPLPELTPDPENDVPDDIEQLILDAFGQAYVNEMEMFAAAEVDEQRLRESHIADGYDGIVGTIDHLQSRGGRELSPDSVVTDVFVVDFEGGSAILRECLTLGPRSGLYDKSGVLLEASEPEKLARDRMLELTGWTETEQPSYRVTQIGFAPREGC